MNDETRKAVIKAYQTSRNSIQDIARINRVEVQEVLEAIGEGNLTSVSTSGDLIDQQEAGPEAVVNYGKQIRVPYSTN